MVTQHNKVCGACMTSFIKLTPGYVSAPLWCDSQGEREKREKDREKKGETGKHRGREERWHVRRNRITSAEEWKTRRGVCGGKGGKGGGAEMTRRKVE